MPIELEWSKLQEFGNNNMDLEDTTNKVVRGVYIWGFMKGDKFIPYYVGKSDNIHYRMFEHIGALLGGSYTIYHENSLMDFPTHKKNINEWNSNLISEKEYEGIVYYPKDLNAFKWFLEHRYNPNVKPHLDNMVKNFRYTYAEYSKDDETKYKVPIYDIEKTIISTFGLENLGNTRGGEVISKIELENINPYSKKVDYIKHLVYWSKGKGSAMQILKHLDNDLISTLNVLLDTKANINPDKDVWYPKGISNKSEISINTFLNNHNKIFGTSKSTMANDLKKWWVTKNGKLPTWDFISSCTISGQKGILLIEAKAHKDEFDTNGKKEPDNKSSEGSKLNHNQITDAIKQANDSINDLNKLDLKISINNCYQLSNRIVHAWWLANNGIPTVLVYLGFLNDPDMKNHFTDKNNWESEFINYAKNVGVDKMIGREIKTSKASFTLLSLSIVSL